jgi:hypothetical protein
VGKSLYLRLVAARLIKYTGQLIPDDKDCKRTGPTSEETSAGSDKREGYLPIFVSCDTAARTARLNNIEFYDYNKKIDIKPVIIIDNAHLCNEDFDEIREAKVVQIYPTRYNKPKGEGGGPETIYILPFRFVEVLENSLSKGYRPRYKISFKKRIKTL